MRYLFFVLLCMLPMSASAAELTLRASDVPRAGSEFKLTVTLTTDAQSINALEGAFVFPEHLTLKRVQDGNSIVNFWIERPRTEGNAVRFAGIIPNGYRGEGEVFELIFSSQETKDAAFSIRDAKVYLNDGEGTEAPLALSSGTPVVPEDIVLNDVTPPEPFTITKSRDESLFEGRPFIVFASQDKESGIDHYEVAEMRGLTKYFPLSFVYGWKKAESPYVLTDESATVYVRAFDAAGNSHVARLSTATIPGYAFGILLLAILLCVAFIYARSRSR